MKILLIRFSSFGDVLQTLSVAGRLGEAFPNAEIHWVTRAEFAPLITLHPRVQKVWTLPRGAGWRELTALGRQLKREKFTHVYDAHNNLRSRVISWQLNGWLSWRVWLGGRKFLRRSLYRGKRFMLFQLRKNFFPQPFSGQFALLEPLQRWNLSSKAPPTPQLYLPPATSAAVQARIPVRDFVALAPSAAFPLKRWPLEYWRDLILQLPEANFVVLGGGEDTFLQELVGVAPERVFNMAGKLSLLESASVISLARVLVSNDTGLMHVAEQIGKPCLALMGPAPFGFPSRPRTEIFEVALTCRPCSKHGQGPCVNAELQKCMRDIKPEHVARSLRRLLLAPMDASVSQS